jgi:hypothetical protein
VNGFPIGQNGCQKKESDSRSRIRKLTVEKIKTELVRALEEGMATLEKIRKELMQTVGELFEDLGKN